MSDSTDEDSCPYTKANNYGLEGEHYWTVGAALPTTAIAYLDDLAKDEGITRGQFLRKLILIALYWSEW